MNLRMQHLTALEQTHLLAPSYMKNARRPNDIPLRLLVHNGPSPRNFTFPQFTCTNRKPRVLAFEKGLDYVLQVAVKIAQTVANTVLLLCTVLVIEKYFGTS